MPNLPTIRQLAPSVADPNAAGVGIGDQFYDPAGVELPAVVQGPAGAQVLLPLGGGGGSAPAFDANDLNAWRCDDAAGSLTLAAAVGGLPLALAGGWVLGDRGLYRASNAAYLPPSAAASSTALSAPTITPGALTSVIVADFIAAPANTVPVGVLLFFYNVLVNTYVIWRLSAGGIQVSRNIGGGGETGSAVYPLDFGVPHQIQSVLTPGVSLALWVDGGMVESVASPGAGLAGADYCMSLGDATSSRPSAGTIGTVRLRNLAPTAGTARAGYLELLART